MPTGEELKLLAEGLAPPAPTLPPPPGGELATTGEDLKSLATLPPLVPEEVAPAPSPELPATLTISPHIFPPGTTEPVGQLPEPLFNLAQGMNVALADVLDLPGTMIAAALRTAGFDIEDDEFRLARRAGAATGFTPPPGVAPEGMAGAVGEMLGLTLATGPAMVAGAARLGTMALGPAGPASKGIEIIGRFGKQIVESALATPKTFFAFETAAATLAGMGGYVTAKMFPESPAAKAIGMIIGGLTPAGLALGVRATASASLLNRARRAIVRVMEPVTPKGAAQRARLRLERAGVDQESALRALDEADVLAEAQLSPAQKIGEPGPLSLEKSIVQSTDALKDKAAARLAVSYAAVRRKLDAFGGGVPLERARATMEELRQTFRSLLDTRMDIATRRADERVAELGPQVNRQAANEIVKEELEAARIAAAGKDGQESELYAAIPQELPGPLPFTRDKWLRILLARRKSDDPADIPAFITQALGKLGTRTSRGMNRITFLKGGLFSETQPIGEAIVLRGRLLRELAAERAKPGASGAKQKLLNDLQTAIVDEDFAALQQALDPAARAVFEGASRFAPEFAALAGKENLVARDAIDAARDFSRQVRTLFDQGPVGAILGTLADRGPRTLAGLTLERGLVRGGPVGRETADALEAAVRFGGNQPRMQAAIEDFLKAEFLKRSVVSGKFIVSKAERFLAQFDEVLDRYPVLRGDLEGATESGAFRDLTMRRLKGISDALSNPKVSKAAIFLNASVDGELLAVARSQNPGAAMAKLVRQVGRDQTGDALKGLKTGFIDFLLKGAELGRISPFTNEPKLLGTKLRSNYNSKPARDMANALLSAAERKRLQTVINTAVRIEGAEATPAALEGIISDVPGTFIALWTRLAGTALGRFGSKKLGFGGTVQAPGLVGNYMSRALASGVQDPAKHLLVDAVFDEKLYRALFTEVSTSPEQAAFVRQQLNAWLASVVATATGLGDEPEPTEPRVKATRTLPR